MNEHQSTHSTEHIFNMSLVKFVLLSPLSSWVAVSLCIVLAQGFSGFENFDLSVALAPPLFLLFFGLIPWSVCGLIVAMMTKEYMRTSIVVLFLSGAVGSILYFAEFWILDHEFSDGNLVSTKLAIPIVLGFAPSIGFAAYQCFKRRKLA